MVGEVVEMMACIFCGGSTKVVDSRTPLKHVLRRRKCRKCGREFRTIEISIREWTELRSREVSHE